MAGIDYLMKLSKKIIIQAIKRWNHVCQTYKNIINSCSQFQIIRKKVKIFLPCIYIKPDDNIKKQFNEKIKLSERKLLKVYGKESVLIIRVAELIGNKNGNKFHWYYYQKLMLLLGTCSFGESTGKKHSREVKNP